MPCPDTYGTVSGRHGMHMRDRAYLGRRPIHIQNALLLPIERLHILRLCGSSVGVGFDLVDRVALLGRPWLCMLGVVLCAWPRYA